MDVGDVANLSDKDTSLSKKFTDLTPSINEEPMTKISRLDIRQIPPDLPFFIHKRKYRTEKARLESFKKWKDPPIEPIEFAAAGMFYIGQSDTVCCYCCGLFLDSWNPGDNPKAKHDKQLPGCRYQENIDSFYKEEPRQFQSHVDYNFSEENIEEIMDTWIVRQALGLNFSHNMIEYAVVQNLLRTGENYHSIVELLKDLEHIIRELEATSITFATWKELQKEKAKKIANQLETKTSDLRLLHNLDPEKIKSQDEDHHRKINVHLVISQTCKVCWAMPKNVLFMPCNHIVCCEECAAQVHECPVCRMPIVETKKSL